MTVAEPPQTYLQKSFPTMLLWEPLRHMTCGQPDNPAYTASSVFVSQRRIIVSLWRNALSSGLCDASSSDGGGRNFGPRGRPLIAAEVSSSSFHSFAMGALCWVLPMEEDWETLEEEAEDGGEAFPSVGLLERLLRLLEEVACCLSCRRSADGVMLLVNGCLL